MQKMKAVQVSRAGGDLEIVERDILETGPGQVRIRVQACGVCHRGFAQAAGVHPMIEKVPLEKAADAYARMMSGDAQHRVVLTMG